MGLAPGPILTGQFAHKIIPWVQEPTLDVHYGDGRTAVVFVADLDRGWVSPLRREFLIVATFQ